MEFFQHSTLKAQTVNTQYGPVTGHMNGTIYEFLGIPFALPPEDTLRWKPTISPISWTTPIVTDSFPPKCSQKHFPQGDTVGVIEGQEDCLYLNVWSPDISANSPVMVFIHGGGNQAGSSSAISGGTEVYHGKNIAERGNIVIVTIQYRLGSLGYLVHPGLELENPNATSGNYGVMDQIFALQWVQNNISQFGGNPNNVTIFGESGGGVNVGNLLTAPSASGLFHKAIIQSATPLIQDYDTLKTRSIDFVNDFISTGTDSAKIAYMRTVPADSLADKLEHPIQGGVVQQAWAPVVDNYIYINKPKVVFQSGNFNNVPLIIGSNSDEMSLSIPQVQLNLYPALLTSIINNTIPASYQAQAHLLYPGNTDQEAKESLIAFYTDAQFTNTTRRTAQCVSLNQTEPVWRYFFTHNHNPAIPSLNELGAYHGMELFYVFNTWENSPYAFGSLFTPQDDSVQTNMLQYWANFAYSGNPNDGILPNWPQYDASTDCYVEIKATPDGTDCGLRTTESDFWDDVSGYVTCSSTVGVEDSYQNSKRIFIYPNPTNGLLNIQTENDYQKFKITIYNLLGKNILSFENKNKIDINSLPTGTYFYKN